MSSPAGTAVVVVNVGGQVLHAKSRRSIAAAAMRWGCDYVEITDPICEHHHFWQKMFVPERVSRYDRVLQLDADMLIRYDAPNPFDICEGSRVGVVQDGQLRDCPHSRWLHRFRTRETAMWSAVAGIEDIPDSEHLNAGFMLYSPSLHADIFEETKRIGSLLRWYSKGIPEQAVLSLVLASCPDRRQWLAHTWNTTGLISRWRPRFGKGPMKTFVYHFNACRDLAAKFEAIESVWWRSSGQER